MKYFTLGIVVGLFAITMMAREVTPDLLSVSERITLLTTLKAVSMLAIVSLPLYWVARKPFNIKIMASIFIVLIAFYGVVLSPFIDDEISNLKAQESIENIEEIKN